MWAIFLAEIFIISLINEFWVKKTEYRRSGRRKYKIWKGITYFITSGLSLLLVERFGEAVFVYTAMGILAGIGAMLSAINANIRNIYSTILCAGAVVLLTVSHFGKYYIILSTLYIVMLYGIILAIQEGVQNMRDGIDPDIIEEQKAARRRIGFKIIKFLIRIWK